MNTLRKVFVLLLCAALMLGTLPLFAFAANEPDDAESLTFDKTVRGIFQKDDRIDLYRIDLPAPGTLTVEIDTDLRDAWVCLQEENVEIFGSEVKKNDIRTVELVAGTYFLSVSNYEENGDYRLKATFEDSGESFPESADSLYNEPDLAPAIELKKEYVGHLALNDRLDCYKLVLPAPGALTVEIDTDLRDAWASLQDEGGAELVSFNTENGKSMTAELVAGTYCLAVSAYDTFGTYRLKTAFKDSGESFPESSSVRYDTTDDAPAIELGKEYVGHLALNDRFDYYKLVLPAPGTLTLTFVTDLPYINGAVHCGDEEEYYTFKVEGKEKKQSFILIAGTYFLDIDHDYDFGAFRFTASLENSGETFPEGQGKLFNENKTAPEIGFGKVYAGQLAENDKADLYKLTIPSERTFSVKSVTGFDQANTSIVDYTGDRVWTPDQETVTLSSGVYYLNVSSYYPIGDYSFFFYLLGDTDNDGKLTAADARTALRMSVNLEPYEEGDMLFTTADYNKNGLIQPDDARSILRISVGLEP